MILSSILVYLYYYANYFYNTVGIHCATKIFEYTYIIVYCTYIYSNSEGFKMDDMEEIKLKFMCMSVNVAKTSIGLLFFSIKFFKSECTQNPNDM